MGRTRASGPRIRHLRKIAVSAQRLHSYQHRKMMTPGFAHRQQKNALPTAVRTGFHFLIHCNLLVCCVLFSPVAFAVFNDCERYRYASDLHKPDLCRNRRAGAGAWELLRDTLSRDGRSRWAVVILMVCFVCAGFHFFRFVCFSSSAHGLPQVRGGLASLNSLLLIVP